jgi:preprotein translocase subunit SecA
MFGLFRGKKPSPFQAEAELIYRTDGARARALARLCREARATVVLVTPFRGHAARHQEALRQLGVEVHLRENSYRSAGQDEGTIPLLTLGAFAALAPTLSGGAPLEVLQVERHPLRHHDDAILPTLAALPRGTRLRVLHSLEDGVFRVFGAGLADLLDRLGMAPEDSIEHPMITRSIAQAQEKLRAKVPDEIPADSFAVWQNRNLRGAPR